MKDQSLPMTTKHGTPGLRLMDFDDLFREVKHVNDALMRRAYQLFEENGRVHGHALDHWLRAESEFLHPVPVDVEEAQDLLTVRAEVPGFQADELKVSVEPRRITITGKRELEKQGKSGKTVYSERRSDQVFRVVHLPLDVDPGKVATNLRDGVLELALSKAAPARQIRVASKVA